MQIVRCCDEGRRMSQLRREGGAAQEGKARRCSRAGADAQADRSEPNERLGVLMRPEDTLVLVSDPILGVFMFVLLSLLCVAVSMTSGRK